MNPIEIDVRDYLHWMEIHNYARTTVECRHRYLGYFTTFANAQGIEESKEVSFELLLSYQHALFAHRKRSGEPLSFGTQAQRLVPVSQFFSWLRRDHRIPINPAADLLMPRPDRRLPESTLTATEMAALLSVPNVSTPLGLRDRAVLEVFFSCALRRIHDLRGHLGDPAPHHRPGHLRHPHPAARRHPTAGAARAGPWCSPDALPPRRQPFAGLQGLSITMTRDGDC